MPPMYALPEILDQKSAIEMPSCMYRLPPIQGYAMGEIASSPSRKKTPSLPDLERRQEGLISRLGRLQGQVNTMRRSLGLEAAAATSSPHGTKKTGPLNLVVQANPSYPPFSLLLLANHLKGQGQIVNITNHVHSSLESPLPGLLLDAFSSEDFCEDRAKVKLSISVIWKGNLSRDPQMSLGLNMIKGEVNILRHAARCLGDLFSSYENSPQDAAKLDDALDLIHSRIVWASSSSNVDSLAKELEAKMATNCLLVEYLAWSALKNAEVAAPNMPKLSGMIKRCAQLAGIPFASSGGGNRNQNQQAKQAGKGNGKKPRTVSSSSSASPSNKAPSNKAPSNKAPSNGGGQGKEKKLFDFFAKNGIKYENIEHPEVFTVEQMMPYLTNVKGAITKNLFLKDKKKNLYLLSCLHDREVKLNDLAKKVGAKELRFGDETIMTEILGVTQGCVTAFALLNDAEAKVKFLADAALLDGSNAKVFFHPLVNTATTGVECADFKKFLAATKHEPVPVKF